MQHPLETLRPFRPLLVGAAEKVFNPYAYSKELKSQLNHLITVCNEATCHEEIALYLRYQAAREGKPIEQPLVDKMIKGAEEVFDDKDFPSEQAIKVAAWRLYAVYLARTYTYKKAQSTARNATTPDHAPNSNRRAQSNR
jgi:hypothetical protein